MITVTLYTGIRHVSRYMLASARMITLVDLLLIAFVNHPPFNNPDVSKKLNLVSLIQMYLIGGDVWMQAGALAEAWQTDSTATTTGLEDRCCLYY